jgi:predicted ATPase
MGRPDPVFQMQLPQVDGALVGRAALLEQLHEALCAGERLITLTGPGGVGKTRLATELAWRIQGDPAEQGDGVHFCDLSEARDASGVGDALARALNLPLFLADGGAPDVEVSRGLAGRGRVLVVLDNFEQVAAHAAETVGQWVDSAREARFVVTSRERLRLPLELAIEIEPLAVPEQRAEVEAVLASPAVQLYLARAARRRGPGGAAGSTPQELHTIGALVRRLEGIPLAVELCACRAGLLSARQLLAEISRGLDRSRSTARGRPSRHATLRAAVQWSWDLLDPGEQRALARLSVLRGGFDLGAAEALIGGEGVEPLDVLEALREKSLLRARSDGGVEGEARLSLLESVRLFAAEWLEASGERGEAERAHAVWFASLGDELARALDDGDERGARERSSLELENLSAAAERSFDAAPGLSARAILGLEATLTVTARFDLAAGLSARAVGAALDAGDERLRARALRMRGEVLRRRNLADAERDLRAALHIAEALGDAPLAARLWGSLGAICREQGRYDEAARLLGCALSLAEGASPRGEALARLELSSLRRRAGALDEAVSHAERALAASRTLGNVQLEGRALLLIGLAHDDQGRLEPALVAIEAALEKLRAAQDRWQEEVALNAAGLLHDELGRPLEARACFDEALAICTELGFRAGAAIITGSLGWLDAAAGRLDAAAGRFLQAMAFSDEVGHVIARTHSRASLGAIEAMRGRTDAAERAFADAEACLREAPSPSARTSIETLRGLLDVARARAADRGGPAASAHLAEARRRLEAARRAPGPSQSGDVRLAVRVLARALGDAPTTPAPQEPGWLCVSEGCVVFQIEGGEPVDLARHGTLRRVLDALVRARRDAPGQPLDAATLFAASWPGERIGMRAARNRLYVALSKLRKLGLSGVLSSRDDGYLIAPTLRVDHAPLRLPHGAPDTPPQP